jgi:hypothetical protein
MQIPFWLFIISLILALTWHDMVSLLLKRSSFLSSLNHISSPFARLLPTIFHHQQQHHLTSSSPNQQQNTQSRPFTQSITIMSPSTQFIETLKNRRTIYNLQKSSAISDTKIQEIIKEAILHVPSAFNSQSTRVILLVKEEHEKLWEITKEVLKGVVPAENFPATEQRLNGFKGGYGTVLFFESRSVVSGMQQNFASYADKFPIWATQSDAMTQYAIWTALESEGLGANLQHYNPLIDAKVAQQWGVDKDWELNAQLVFGDVGAKAGEKGFKPVEERFKVFGV